MFLIVLLPSVFNKDKLFERAYIFSKINFWFENTYYVLDQFMTELYLVPIIYFKVLFSILKLEGLHGIHLFLGYMIVGLPYNFSYGLCRDMYNYIQILRTD